MKSPEEEYKFMKTLDNIWDIASFTLFEKYIIQNLKGYNKLIEIDSTDQESLMISMNGGYPIPGMIYTFIYKGKDMFIELKKGGKQEFVDYIPLVFCINNGPGYFNGINLNMIPAEPRLGFIQSYYETFKDFFENIEIKTQNDKLALNKKFVEYIKGGNGQKIINIFNRKNGANYNYGYRKYLIGKVDRLRMIEYSEWNYIPFYRPREAFRTLPVDQIHKLYYRSK